MITAHENDKKLYKSPKIKYNLNPKILFNELSLDIPNVEFITENNYLTDYIIKINGIITGEEGEKRINCYSNILAKLLTIQSSRHITVEYVKEEFIEEEGLPSIYNDLSIRYNIQERPVNLNIKDNFLKLRDSPYIDQLRLRYVANSISLSHERLLEYSIIEAFKVIEQNKQFPDYWKYYALRNIVAHSPRDTNSYYDKGTLESFDSYFNQDDFDYLEYERKDNKLKSLLLDFESDKTQIKLLQISHELIKKIREDLKI